MYYFFFIHSPVDGNLGCFHVLAIVNSAAINIEDTCVSFIYGFLKWQPTPAFLPGVSQGQEPGGLPSMGSHRVGHD